MTVDITLTVHRSCGIIITRLFFSFTGAGDCGVTETLADDTCADACRVGKKTKLVTRKAILCNLMVSR